MEEQDLTRNRRQTATFAILLLTGATMTFSSIAMLIAEKGQGRINAPEKALWWCLDPWHEWYPSSWVEITNLTINPGDLILMLICTAQGAGSTTAIIYFGDQTLVIGTGI